MLIARQDDDFRAPMRAAGTASAAPSRTIIALTAMTTSFVESCVGTIADSAVAAERRARGRPRANRLLKVLADKRNVLVTTHMHPDPDALASASALTYLLEQKLKNAAVSLSIKGRMAGGINEVFVRHANLKLKPWDDAALKDFDAIVLLDTQPSFAFSPLPPEISPTAVIDHHRSPHARPHGPFCDIRVDVGATSSIIFSYFMELQLPIKPDLAATLLYAIESDLAGAAGTPGELDNVALSSLTLLADPRKLYQMRYVDLPQSYYVTFTEGLSNAVYYDHAIISHLDHIDSLERPAVVADFLLRFDKVDWALVTAVHEGKLLMSLRTSSTKMSAADMAKRLLRKIGDGGGHRSKAGGFIKLETSSEPEIDRWREQLRRRFLRALLIKGARPQKLVPKVETASQ
jgi:nanoRNase/pAp phosphatase (c-di-AMP/oligoRNAs hydrolase)